MARKVKPAKHKWPKAITEWMEDDIGLMSVPFTWLLPEARARLRKGKLFAKRWIVGGPAVQLMPDYLKGIPDVEIRDQHEGVLQKVNPLATRTTLGCPNRCKFCGIGERMIEGDFCELPDWPDLPVLCDNNLLAASASHFDRVIDRLLRWGWCDFNQGLDARFLTDHHARRIAEIKGAVCRVALDHDNMRSVWAKAVEGLLSAGVAKRRIRAYVLVGFDGDPEKDWRRCEFVESFGVDAYPMWYHPLDALKPNDVTPLQQELGWTQEMRLQIMGWYYRHRGQKLIDPLETKPEGEGLWSILQGIST